MRRFPPPWTVEKIPGEADALCKCSIGYMLPLVHFLEVSSHFIFAFSQSA
jgi:hypothetical protein